MIVFCDIFSLCVFYVSFHIFVLSCIFKPNKKTAPGRIILYVLKVGLVIRN